MIKVNLFILFKEFKVRLHVKSILNIVKNLILGGRKEIGFETVAMFNFEVALRIM